MIRLRPFVRTPLVLATCWLACFAHAAGPESDVRPGERDPIPRGARRTLFRDQEVLLAASGPGGSGLVAAELTPADGTLARWRERFRAADGERCADGAAGSRRS